MMGITMSLVSPHTLTSVLCGCILLYVVVLLAVNAIPHVSVRSIGWFSLKGVTVEFHGTKVVIELVYMRINIAWSADMPFRMVNVAFYKVSISYTDDGQNHPKRTQEQHINDIPTELSFRIPTRVHHILFTKNWLNEVGIHCHHLSVTHHKLHKDISLHIDYCRIEGLHALELGNHRLAFSAIDGYVRDDLAGAGSKQIRVLHTLELGINYGMLFSCPWQTKSHMLGQITNLGFSFGVGDLYIPKIPHLMDGSAKQKTTSSELKIPSMRTILGIVNLISLIQIKIEQSVVEYRELQLESSSYAINYRKDTSFRQQVLCKVSSYITAGRILHLGLACVEIPSLTYLLETNLTEMFLAYHARNSDYFIDLTTSLNVTNPEFNFYFDQFSFVLGSLQAKKPKDASTEHKFNVDKWLPVILLIKKFRKSSLKVLVIDAKGTLHTPDIDEHEFHRDAMSNVVTNGGISLINYRTSSKNLGRLIDFKCMGSSVPLTLKSYLRMKNIHLDVGDNEIHASNLSMLIGYCVNTNNVALKIVSRRLQVRSVNTMIFHVIRRVQEARISHFNEACANMENFGCAELDNVSDIVDEQTVKDAFIDLFSILPPVVASVKFQSSLLLMIIICNDALPSHIVHDDALDSDIDLGTFKRGVSFSMDEMAVDYKRQDEIFKMSVRQIQANTMSDHASEYIEGFDQVTQAMGDIDFEDVSSLDSQGENIDAPDEDSLNKVKRVLFINDLVVENPKGVRDKLVVHTPEIDGRFDMFLAWCLMYAHTLVDMIAPQVEKHYSQEQVRQLQGKSKKINLDVHIDSIALVARLVHDVDILVEVDLLNVTNVFAGPQCRLKFLRLYVVQPATKLWSRLVSIADTFVDLENLSASTLTINSKSVRLNIPFQYLVYTVIDNVITSIKTVRQIKQNFRHLAEKNFDFKRILPDIMEAVKMPRVRWKSKTFGITLENDAFETELGMIFELGNIEQIERIRKEAYFEEQVEKINSQVKESLTKKSVAEHQFLSGQKSKKHLSKMKFNVCEIGPSITESLKKKTHVRNGSDDMKSSTTSEIGSDIRSGSDIKSGNSDMKSGTTSPSNDKKSRAKSATPESEYSIPEVDNDLEMTEERAKSIISKSRAALEKDFATSWIQKFKKLKHSRYKSWDKRLHDLWGEDEINSLMKNKFEIQDYAPGVPQFTGVFRDHDLLIDKLQIPDLDKFLYDYGKGQPKLEYTILIPLFFQLRSSSVYFCIKDYVLPLLSFPSSDHEGTPVMDFLGNIVVNEKLVYAKEEMRHIYVPFSPAALKVTNVDNFYSAHIIRTLTPIKFMFDLKCNLVTQRACIISWSKSYLPSISSIMSSFDNFTKPQIDDSPLGWWDKVALIAHGKIKFNIENELCMHIKSSMSPYKLVGESSGFVFCWKNNVSLRINDTGKSSEVVILESDDFILGIPNYSTAEKRTWSLFYSDGNDYVHDSESESRKFLKRVMKFSSDEKVCWKLGFLFEQNVDRTTTELSSNQKRTQRFKPHYDVRVTSPEFEWHPDSYEDYRSDYIHMAISVRSKSSKQNAYNAAYFTPLSFRYFFHWWDTISDTVSLPIREGKLFSTTLEKLGLVKMGPHLFTFKYQLELEPLTISHVYLSAASLDKGQNVVSSGLKGKCTRCVIDLHQRKEVVRYVNEKLGIDKKVRKLKFNLGEIDITNADIRLLYATFSDISLRSQILSYYAGETVQDDENSANDLLPNNNTDWIRRMTVTDGDFLWIDLEDFNELEERQLLSADPKVDLIPFFFTPKFTFFREFTLENPEGDYPFGYERSHDCLIGAQPPEAVQAMLLEKRVQAIKDELDESANALNQLEEINNPVFHDDYKRIKKEIAQNERRMDKVSLIYEEVKGASRAPSLMESSIICPKGDPNSEISSQGSIQRVVSKQPSVYSNFKSLEDAREVTSMNTSVSDYHNRFLVHNLQLKWNNQIRDLFMTYLQLVDEKRTASFSMTKKAIDLVQSIFKSVERDSDSVSEQDETNDAPDEEISKYFNTGDDVIDGFDEYLQNINEDGQEIEFKYLVRLIRPQVQMISDADLKSCILSTSQQIEMRILCINIEGTNDIISENGEEMSLVETRYGVLFQDLHLFAFERSNFGDLAPSAYAVSSKQKKWPPWVDLEVCDDSSWLEDNLIVERTNMAVSLTKPNILSMDSSTGMRSSQLVANLSKLVLNATSSQYSAMYFVVTDLLIHSKTVRDAFHQRWNQILAVTDISDYIGLTGKVQQLQTNIRICRSILLKMDERHVLLSDQEQRDKAHVETELERMKLDLELIIMGLKSLGNKVSGGINFSRNWHIRADQIIWHILEDNRDPLIDLALATSLFTRVDQQDGSNINTMEISMIQGFNLQPSAVYPELLRPYLEALQDQKGTLDKPMIRMTWKMLNPVGGIRVMSNSELEVQPMHIQLDYNSANKMVSYLFPKEDNQDSSLTDESEPDTTLVDSVQSEASSNPFRKLMARRKKSRLTSSLSSVSGHSSSKRDELFDLSSAESSGTSRVSSFSDSVVLKASHLKKKKERKELNVDDVALIMSRSSKYMVIGEVKVKSMKLCISFKAPKHLNIIDVHNLKLLVPQLHYENKTWSGADFVNQFKKDIIKVVLSHSGKIIGNKFKQRKRQVASSPLKQISDYSLYMSLDDLEVDGRSREQAHRMLHLDSNGIQARTSSMRPAAHHRWSLKPRENVDISKFLDTLSEGALSDDEEKVQNSTI